MNWNSGFSALYELELVDPVSWMDAGSIDLTGGTVNRSDTELIESANLKMTHRIRESWVRVYLKAKQTGGSERVAIFTGLAITPQRDLDGVRESYSTECYSCIPVSLYFVWELNMFFSGFLIGVFPCFRTDAGLFAAFVCQIVRKYPSGSLKYCFCKHMVAM